uniref:decorin-like n=1 Tax=Myxine glutinosa TaxID=7769 RepID=UPI00358F6D58
MLLAFLQTGMPTEKSSSFHPRSQHVVSRLSTGRHIHTSPRWFVLCFACASPTFCRAPRRSNGSFPTMPPILGLFLLISTTCFLQATDGAKSQFRFPTHRTVRHPSFNFRSKRSMENQFFPAFMTEEMMADEGSGGKPKDIDVPVKHATPRTPARRTEVHVPEQTCPFTCQCQPKLIQCSNVRFEEVPEKLPAELEILDLQDNKITEIKDDDFSNLVDLEVLILRNNKISVIQPNALAPLVKLQRLYLSRNALTTIPPNIPPTIMELRLHDNYIEKIMKDSMKGLNHLICAVLGSNPLSGDAIAAGAFSDMAKLAYLRIAETNITSIPTGLPGSLKELHLDSNKIKQVKKGDFANLVNLIRLGLSANEIETVDDEAFKDLKHVKEIHLDSNQLTAVPPGLPDLKKLQTIFLHNNQISKLSNDSFCSLKRNYKRVMYTVISLHNNKLNEIPQNTYSCLNGRGSLHLGNS